MKGEEYNPDMERFYYFRDNQKHPRITVCLAKYGDVLTRGISICSFSEKQIIKNKGRNIASKRARLAYIRKMNTLPISREEAFDVIDYCGQEESFPAWHKSEYQSVLTEFEKRLLNRKGNS